MRYRKEMALKGLMIILCALLLAGCNEPPRYSKDAIEFLRSQGVDDALAIKFTEHQPLTEDEVATLQVYDNIAVKHLSWTLQNSLSNRLCSIAFGYGAGVVRQFRRRESHDVYS